MEVEGDSAGTPAKTPSELGYSMPAEWARHESTWLSWPKNPLTFPPEVLPKVEASYVQMVEAIAKGEGVNILVDDEKAAERVRSMLSAKRVSFHTTKTADVWVRDYGPIFVRRESGRQREVAATKWVFNAWGNKYEDLLPDDAAGLEIARSTRLRVFETGVILEGGSIDVNGRGILMTSEQCLLNKNRNPGLSKAQIEQLLASNLGVDSVVWLKDGIAGDDTDGHVDDIARFVNEDTVVVMSELNPGAANYAPLKRAQAVIANHKDSSGHRLQVVPIHMPSEVRTDEGRLPASYANFYIANAAVLIPVFGDSKKDTAAVETLERFFPGRKIVPIDSRGLVYGFGAIHCVTQQQPSS